MHEVELFYSVSFFRALITITDNEPCIFNIKVALNLMFSPNSINQISKTGTRACKTAMSTKAIDHIIRIRIKLVYIIISKASSVTFREP